MSTKTKNNKVKHTLCSVLTIVLSLFIYFLILMLASGCAAKRVVVKNEVVESYIPVQSNITAPTLAKYIEYNNNDTEDDKHLKRLKNRSNIFIYVEELENTDKAHRGEL